MQKISVENLVTDSGMVVQMCQESLNLNINTTWKTPISLRVCKKIEVVDVFDGVGCYLWTASVFDPCSGRTCKIVFPPSLAFSDAAVRRWLCRYLANIWWTLWGSKMFVNDVCTDSWCTVMWIPLILFHLLEISDFDVCTAACHVDRHFIRFLHSTVEMIWHYVETCHELYTSYPLQITVTAIMPYITCTRHLRVFFVIVKNIGKLADGPTLCVSWQRQVNVPFRPPIRYRCRWTSDSFLPCPWKFHRPKNNICTTVLAKRW